MTDQPPGRAYEHVQRKLTEQERTALRESLAAHGLRDAITLDQHGDILDGYNREDLCRELGIKPVYRVLEVTDPVHWIRHNQTARRNLSEAEMRELIVETKAQNPEASTRTIAEKLGTSFATVARTLRNTTVSGDTVNKVKGKDGKVRTYKAKPKQAPQMDKAVHAIERREQAGEPVTREAIVAEAGVSRGIADSALAAHKASAKPDPDAIVLSMSAQEKYDAKLRAYAKEFDYKVETLARELHRKWREENSLPAYFQKLEEVERLLKDTRFALMPLAHFMKILSRLHPDRARPGDEKDANEAFTLFNSYKLKLVDLSAEKDEKARLKRIELRGNPLPRTVEEMLARKTMKRR
jgi:hypothetical protein